MEARVFGRGEADEDYAGDQRGDGHGAFAAEVGDVDGEAGEDGAWDADGGCYRVVAVGGAGVVGGHVLGEEGVEEGVAQSDCYPAEPEEGGWFLFRIMLDIC